MNMTKTISFKSLLNKATSAKSALGFLSAYREHLLTGELTSVLSPIVSQVDEGTLMATPAVELIAQAVLNHIVASDAAALEARIAKQAASVAAKAIAALPKNEEEKAPAPWTVTILDSTGQICTRTKDNGDVEELVKGFNDSSTADRWSMRRLLENESGSTAVCDHAYLPIHTVMTRDIAVSVLLKTAKGPVVRSPSKGSQKLSFGVKAHESRAVFSRG